MLRPKACPENPAACQAFLSLSTAVTVRIALMADLQSPLDAGIE
jgi:hypothetical protein